MDILAQQADNKSSNISKEQLVTILNKYFEPTEINLIPDEISTTSDIPLITLEEKYQIQLSNIYTGKVTSGNELSNLEKLKLYFGGNNFCDDQGNFLDDENLGIREREFIYPYIGSFWSGIDNLYYFYIMYQGTMYRVTCDDDNNGNCTGDVVIAEATKSKGLCELDGITIFIAGNMWYDDMSFSGPLYLRFGKYSYGPVYQVDEYDLEGNLCGKKYYTEDGDWLYYPTYLHIHIGEDPISPSEDDIENFKVYLKDEELEYISKDSSVVVVDSNGVIEPISHQERSTLIIIRGKNTNRSIAIFVVSSFAG